MFNNALFYSLCIICLFLSACVSKDKYVELETSLNALLKERNESLSDLQARHNELQSEKEQLLATIEDLKLNLGQARADIREKQNTIEELTLRIGEAQSVIREKQITTEELTLRIGEAQSDIREKQNTIEELTLRCGEAQSVIREKQNTIEELTLRFGEAQSVIRQKDSTIGTLRLDLGLTQAMVREKENTISELDKTRREIETSLKDQIAQKDVKIEQIEGKLRVTFVDKILFDSGSTKIKDRGKEVLLTLAESFGADTDKTIVVEGHTDNVEIGYPLRERFPSNWELSTARAASVVRFLQEKANISPERLTATGFSFYRPVAPNNTDTRSQNGRIEIILIPIR